VFLAACGTAVAQTPEPEGRTLSINGSAQVSLAPDITYITIGVTTKDADAAAAVEQNNLQATNVINKRCPNLNRPAVHHRGCKRYIRDPLIVKL
jgi:uncharacterized protein YggE